MTSEARANKLISKSLFEIFTDLGDKKDQIKNPIKAPGSLNIVYPKKANNHLYIHKISVKFTNVYLIK